MAEQTELFGAVGGLFGPDTIATTPIDELTLPRESPGGIVTSTRPVSDELRAELTAPTAFDLEPSTPTGGLFEHVAQATEATEATEPTDDDDDDPRPTPGPDDDDPGDDDDLDDDGPSFYPYMHGSREGYARSCRCRPCIEAQLRPLVYAHGAETAARMMRPQDVIAWEMPEAPGIEREGRMHARSKVEGAPLAAALELARTLDKCADCQAPGARIATPDSFCNEPGRPRIGLCEPCWNKRTGDGSHIERADVACSCYLPHHVTGGPCRGCRHPASAHPGARRTYCAHRSGCAAAVDTPGDLCTFHAPTAPAADLFAAVDDPEPLCNVGTPKPGEARSCTKPATHAARWAKYRDHADDEHDHETNGIRCCVDHADYYATAWCPRYPGERGAAWIEPLNLDDTERPARCSCTHYEPGRKVRGWGMTYCATCEHSRQDHRHAGRHHSPCSGGPRLADLLDRMGDPDAAEVIEFDELDDAPDTGALF